MTISSDQFKAIYGQPKGNQLQELNDCLKRFDITTLPRLKHFLSQIGHESAGLRYTKEIDAGWYIPTKFGLPAIAASDGAYKYRGGGYGQLSMPENYEAFAKFMGDPKIYDLGCPYVAENYAFSSFGFWWLNNQMNPICDRGATVEEITRKVNGGVNGLADRIEWWKRVCKVLEGSPQAQKAQLKPGEYHLVVNDWEARFVGEAKCYDASGKLLWTIPALCKGVEGPVWTIRGGDTPPGLYKAGSITKTGTGEPTRIWNAYGPWFIDLVECEHQEAKQGRSGIGLHGGGTAAPNPLSDRQQLVPTLGCIRVHNIDLIEKIVPMVQATQAQGLTVWITVNQFD